MAYCRNCGSEIVPGAKFCQNCGTPTSESGASRRKREQVYEGKIYKCPNCGEVLKSFMRNCPSCGLELRGTKATSAIREFAVKLEAIESRREYERPGLFSKLKRKQSVPKTDEQKISLIKSFAVPNTVEDMLEFMILATANVDTSQFGMVDPEDKANKEVAKAWESKINQVYTKARHTYGNEEDFKKIQELYDLYSRDLRRQKRYKRIKWVALVGWIPLLWIVIFGLMAITEPQDNAKEQERLEAIVVDVEVALEDEDYKLALRIAESIEYKGTDSEQERKWNIKRETLIDQVIDEAAKNGVELQRTEDNMENEDTGGGGFIEGFKRGAQSDEAEKNIDEAKRIMKEGSDSKD